MIANYHTHTPRCRHAIGTEEEYVRAAIDRGLQILGFSDHTPYFFPGSHYSTMRMYPEDLAGYVQAVQQVQQRYADQIDIHLGLEAEYYPDLFPTLLPFLQEAGIEYLILGQHYLGNEIGEAYNGRKIDSEDRLIRYCDQVIQAMQTGYFSYLAHPDLICFPGDLDFYRHHMQRLCEAAKSLNMPLEINLAGLHEQKHYPNPHFWEVAGKVGCTTVLGCDAHSPDALGDTETERKALEMVSRYSLPLVETVTLRSIQRK